MLSSHDSGNWRFKGKRTKNNQNWWTVAILAVLYHEGLVALWKGIKGFILQPGSEMSLPPKQFRGQNTRGERIWRRKKMEKEARANSERNGKDKHCKISKKGSRKAGHSRSWSSAPWGGRVLEEDKRSKTE